jgi:F0F1-type ATP synthase assembly protein I
MTLAAQDSLTAPAILLLAIWGVLMVVVFVGPRVSEPLVRRLSGSVVWVLVVVIAVSVLAVVFAALTFSVFWALVVGFVSVLMLGFSTPVLVAKAGEKVFEDRRPPEERVVAVEDGRYVTEADEEPGPSRDAVAFESVLHEQEESLHPLAEGDDVSPSPGER